MASRLLYIAVAVLCIASVSARTQIADAKSSKALITAKASTEVQVKIEPFTIGILVTSIVIAIANVAVEAYKVRG